MRSGFLRATVVVVGLIAGAVATAQSPAVTFHKDVEPILQKNCQTCHRPGQVAPMSFMTYENARPYARAMKTAVASRKMPPWFADPHYGPYLNDRSLSQRDIDMIANWVDAGALEGSASDAPPPVQWPEGWFIKPDVKRVRYEVNMRLVRRGKLAVGIANGSVFADDACVYLAKDMRVGLIASAT